MYHFGMEPILPVFFLSTGFTAICLAFYLLPSIIAKHRSHLNFIPILLLNLFLGWSVIGWIAALIWSMTKNTEELQYKSGTPIDDTDR
jgi:hypothetical protein